MDEENDLLSTIINDAKANRLQLPTLPDIAIRLGEAMRDPDKGLQDITRIIQVDPAITAQLIRIANSPFYHVHGQVETCQAAITRMGLNATRNLVTSLALKNLFNTDLPALQSHFHQCWYQSCWVASISYVIATLNPGIDPDRALLGGLVHNIGALPILQYLGAHPDAAKDEAMIEHALKQLSPSLGHLVLKAWNFDDDLNVIPTQIEEWQRDSGQRIDYSDVVQVAYLHSRFGTNNPLKHPPLQQIPSFNKLIINQFGPDASIELLEQSHEEITAILHMLHEN